MARERPNLKCLTRRELLALGVRTGALLPIANSAILRSALLPPGQRAQQSAPPDNAPFFQVDEALLEEVENAAFRFFWEQANPETGIVRDRCNAVTPDKSDLGS